MLVTQVTLTKIQASIIQHNEFEVVSYVCDIICVAVSCQHNRVVNCFCNLKVFRHSFLETIPNFFN